MESRPTADRVVDACAKPYLWQARQRFLDEAGKAQSSASRRKGVHFPNRHCDLSRILVLKLWEPVFLDLQKYSLASVALLREWIWWGGSRPVLRQPEFPLCRSGRTPLVVIGILAVTRMLDLGHPNSVRVA